MNEIEENIINNIFFIQNQLEEYTRFLEQECASFHFYTARLEDLPAVVANRKKYDTCDYYLENNLIIINRDLYLEYFKHHNKNEFIKQLGMDYPFFIFIVSQENPGHIQNSFFAYEDDFYYYLSEQEKTNNKWNTSQYFFQVLFKYMVSKSSLHKYIINSFENIVNSVVIEKQKKEIQSLYNQLDKISKIDILTNILNRAALFDELTTEIKRAERASQRVSNYQSKAGDNNNQLNEITDFYGKFSCLMIDIDNFKFINDTYGHLAGDYILRELGNLFNSRTLFRNVDIKGRYGGEEFIVFLPETNSEHARIPAERFRMAVKNLDLQYEGKIIKISVSIGITEFQTGDTKSEDIIRRADTALLYAKKQGKDRVVFYSALIDN